MDQHTRDEGFIQLIDAMWHMVEHLRNMDRTLHTLERRGIQIRLDIPKNDEDLKRLKKKIWPAVDNKITLNKSKLLTQLKDFGKLISET